MSATGPGDPSASPATSPADGATSGDVTLDDGASVEVQGSSSRYTLSRTGSVYMCSCPAWRNQGAAVDRRTCKHLRAYLGDAAETARAGVASAPRTGSSTSRAAVKKDSAPPILLAHAWPVDHDPTGWWMSEKLDGIRAYWNGTMFVSRLGNRFVAPAWFTEAIPSETLDGELWVGRKKFQRTTSIVRSAAGGQEWTELTFVVFDAPNAPGTFEERQVHAQDLLTRSGAPHARWLEHVRCDGVDHLRAELSRVEALGGEGLMLRRPGSPYAVGRSQSLLKVKTFHDTEARVVGHAPGTGKHEGRLGALICELPDGTGFNVGTGFSDAEREAPPAIGAVITFRYQELSADGVPRFPSYVGERVDVELPARPAAARAMPKDPAPIAVDAAAPAGESSGSKIRLVHDAEHKFWEIEVRGAQHVTRFGKVGSPGQMRVSELGSESAARADAEKRAGQKQKAGYRIDEPPR